MAMPAEEAPPWEGQRSDAWAPPSSDEAELGLLGAIFANNAAYDKVSDFLRPDHFADGTNAKIFMACEKMINQGQEANAVTLSGLFENDPALEQIGGKRYLAQIQSNFVTVINAKDYARTIHDCWLRRRTITIAGEAIDYAYRPDIDTDGAAIVEAALDELTDLAESGQREGGLVGIARLAKEVAERSAAIRKGEIEPGIQTGLTDLDRLTGGLHRQDLIILAGRPGMGKTALATRIAHGVASRMRTGADAEGGTTEQPQPVAFFSLEMSSEQLSRRIASERAGVEFEHTQQRDGLAEHEFEGFVRACMDLRGIPLMVDGTPGLSPAQIHARALGMKRRQGLSLIVVDHLGYVKPPHRSNSRHLDLSDITKALKATAKRLDVPVLLLCQLNRGVEGRDDKRPGLSDLRESGAIEEDADAVFFCYRDHYYIQRQEPKQKEGEDREQFSSRLHAWEQRRSNSAGKGEVIIGKQRNGPLETVRLAFIDRFMRWDNLARDLYGES
ncbi:replicative DNA helicase [Pelagibius litoralis]|uniref:Replicative DNA helicase n=1 Tax=Pelagibius litoralis TaxID=374515 RepID=A0A967F3G1_9PROT|nr:replicative DNA helicase [Pelagibius litoralis]NIA72289.1 replicative DNA helicase [Pelagibius litoralis]